MVPNLMNDSIKKERVRKSKEFLAMVHHHSSMLDNCYYGQVSRVFHIPEMKQQSKQ